VVDADKVINAPVVKHHNLAKLTGAMKNWIGITGKLRMGFHGDIQRSIAELAALMRPTLTVVDATRVLMRNGPQGGNLADVEDGREVIPHAQGARHRLGVLAGAVGEDGLRRLDGTEDTLKAVILLQVALHADAVDKIHVMVGIGPHLAHQPHEGQPVFLEVLQAKAVGAILLDGAVGVEIEVDAGIDGVEETAGGWIDGVVQIEEPMA
jgi:hypothetical protein